MISKYKPENVILHQDWWKFQPWIEHQQWEHFGHWLECSLINQPHNWNPVSLMSNQIYGRPPQLGAREIMFVSYSIIIEGPRQAWYPVWMPCTKCQCMKCHLGMGVGVDPETQTRSPRADDTLLCIWNHYIWPFPLMTSTSLLSLQWPFCLYSYTWYHYQMPIQTLRDYTMTF